MTAPNNDFVKNAYDGLFLESERRTIFEHVLPEVLEVIQENINQAEEARMRISAEQKKVAQSHTHNNSGTGDIGNFGSYLNQGEDDPLFALYSTLQHRIEDQENTGQEQFQQLAAILEKIQAKTDTIKEKKVRPADFE